MLQPVYRANSVADGTFCKLTEAQMSKGPSFSRHSQGLSHITETLVENRQFALLNSSSLMKFHQKMEMHCVVGLTFCRSLLTEFGNNCLCFPEDD